MGAVGYIRNWTIFLKKYDHWRFLLAEVNKIAYLKSYLKYQSSQDRSQAMHHAAKWLIKSMSTGNDARSSTFYFNASWTSSYPETTGYIIPTLLRYSSTTDSAWSVEAKQAAVAAGKWLLDIQHADGGWPGGYIHQDRPSVVFNSGQILRGLHALHHVDQSEDWKGAAKRCIDWIWDQLDDQGRFSTNDYMEEIRVYGTYVVAPILEWVDLFPLENESWKEKASLHAKWVMSQQNELGWFANCDNTLHKNDKPIIHTIAYTVDGLWNIGVKLSNEDCKEAALVPARVLATEFLSRGMLSGRYTKNWIGSESFIPTGGAQLAILWESIFQITGEPIWEEAFLKMNILLVAIAKRGTREDSETIGALPGSFPFWGRYETFGLPNWATKYMLDSLLNEHEKYS